MAYTYPADNHIINDLTHVTDHNNIIDILKNNTSLVYNVQNTAYGGGAKGDGTTDDTTAIQDAVNACISNGSGIVYFPATTGGYKVSSTLTAAMSAGNLAVKFVGDGPEASFIKWHGTGDVIRMYSSAWTGRQRCEGSGVQGLCIDGTSAGTGAASTGLHVGDIYGLHIDHLKIMNLTASGSIGAYFHNTVQWTEEADVRAFIGNCTTGVTYGLTSPGTNSFGYGNWDFTFDQTGGLTTGGQDGISLTGGASVYHGSVRVRGNFQGSSTALTNAVIRSAGGSHIQGSRLDIQVESTTGTSVPTTFILDSSSSFAGCYGILDFGSGGSGSFNNSNLAAGQLVFTGVVNNETSILAGAGYNQWTFGTVDAPVPYNYAPGVHGGGFETTLGDFFTTTLSANLTVALTSSFFNSNKTLGAPQRITIIITQASGGGFTVTWPHTGSPSTSSPTVKWPGGTAPTMSAGANAVDVYKLETYDGATWFGQAVQNVS